MVVTFATLCSAMFGPVVVVVCFVKSLPENEVMDAPI